MAITQSEAAKYTVNSVKRGVLEEIIKDSFIMQNLKFIDVVGNAYQYLRENSLGSANFYDPNEPWSEDTGDVTQVTASIKILGGDADVDNFLKATRSDKTDFEAENIDMKAKAVKHTFLDNFYYGSVSANAKSFDGIQTLMNSTTAQVVNMAGALSVATLETQMDLVLDGKGDGLFMSKANRRRLTQYFRAKNNVNLMMNNAGERLKEFNEVPIYVDDFLTQTETVSGTSVTAKTGSNTSSVLYLSFGDSAVLGLQNGGLSIKKLGQLMNKDSVRWRIKWYVGLALMRTIRVARVHGITAATVVD